MVVEGPFAVIWSSLCGPTYKVTTVEYGDRSALGLRHGGSQVVPSDACLHSFDIMRFQAGLQHLAQLLHLLLCQPD